MQTYTTPRLVAKGDVVELTKAVEPGTGDPIGDLLREPLGSVGFNL